MLQTLSDNAKTTHVNILNIYYNINPHTFSSEFQTIKNFEIFYPGELKRKHSHPFKEATTGRDYIPVGCKEELNVGTLKVPAKYLSHSTHNESASRIIEQNQYLFIPQEKKGKDYSCSQAFAKNGSYRFNKMTGKFRKIPASKPVLPGHLIWWGINVSEWYKGDGRAIGQAIERMQHQGVYTAQYLANPPGSKYGSKHIIFYFVLLSLIFSVKLFGYLRDLLKK